MKFYTKNYLRNLSSSGLRGTKTFSAAANENKHKTAFDIFLSHSFKDKEYISGLYLELTAQGYSVYVDWIIDPHLQRGNVTKETAEHIRNRMKQSKSLIYATSDNASTSKWMPWELGFMDGEKGRCAILPITEYETSNFAGQEFLSIYPYVGKDYVLGNYGSGEVLWVNENQNTKIQMSLWQKGHSF